ncbi:hypothetical protein EDC04DRAFT_2601501 [Pisolithus marmoratus]|nr:hypothetical protein EDC04DRAFT_2601501 [Pisolithus marmoratus]
MDSKYCKSLFAKEKIYLHILGLSTEVGATGAPSVSDQEDKAVDANNAGSMGNEDNGNGDNDDNDDDDKGEDLNDEYGDCEDGRGQQGNGSGCVDKLSDQQVHLHILSPSVCSAAGVVTTHTVAPNNPTAATFPSIATLLHAVALGNPSVTTHPNIATPPCAAVPNFPVNPRTATWSTSQWSGSGQVSSQIPVLSTIADMDTSVNYLSGRAYYDYQNAPLGLPPIPSIVPSPQSNSDLPLLLSAPSGEISKENSLLTLVGKKPKKLKMKHSAEDDANGFPVKRPKNKKTATE